MNIKLKSAPFKKDDRILYFNGPTREGDPENPKSSKLMRPGMVASVVRCADEWIHPFSISVQPWHCRLRFATGYEITIIERNLGRFKKVSN